MRPYSMFNIDFNKYHRPTMQCVMPMTLRKILEQAVSSPPVILDASASNLECILVITHPYELNQEQRSKILDTTQAIMEQRQDLL
ncbi:hypothetical protein BG003_010217, partial [Podila horticola]